jgi:hypothetical protein
MMERICVNFFINFVNSCERYMHDEFIYIGYIPYM